MKKKIQKFDAFIKNGVGSYEKVEEPVELVQITGVLTDPVEIEKIEENLNLASVPNLQDKDIKRGQIIWLTALIQQKGTVSYSNQTSTCVLQCRIVNIFKGLNYLKNVIKNK